MSDATAISWTDHTFNPWLGCQRISPACDNCYAAEWDKRFGGTHWDKGNPPRAMSDANWKKPAKWQRLALELCKRPRVFCGSMCDVFDKRAPEGQRGRLYDVIRSTPMLDWQLLTKRAPNIAKFLPDDWGNGYHNVWLGVTVEDVLFGKPRIDILRQIPARIRFLSIEPLLEDLRELDLTGIHWVIIGGESGPGCRTMNPHWVDSVIEQCRAQNVAVWFKQWGGNTKDKGGHLINDQIIQEWPV